MTAADCLWCVLQVTLVGLLSAVVYLFAGRRSPRSATGVLMAGLTIPALLTAAVNSPWPCWITAPPPPESIVPPAIVAPAAHEIEWPASAPALPPMTYEATPAIAVSPVIDPAPVPVPVPAAPATIAVAERDWPRIGLYVVAILLIIGAVRLIAGWIAIRKLLACSRSIDHRATLALCADLQRQLGCCRTVELRESDRLTTAATVGWRRPAILLPGGWRSWSDDERCAILAHELAHIVRGHFAAWIIAQCGLSLHVYHPLLHWLAARLRLEQEYEADALAARVSGGPDAYLRTLAHLALQQPQVPVSWPARAFLARPGAVVRRIQRLQASSEPHASRLFLRAAMVLLVMCGALGAAGLRPPTTADDSSPEPIAGVKQPAAPRAGRATVTVAAAEAETTTGSRRETSTDDTAATVKTEFLVADEQNVPIKSGTLHLRGYYDNSDFFGLDRPVEGGRATFEFQRPRLREFAVSVTAVGFLSYHRQYEVEGTDRGFAVAAKYTYTLRPGVAIGGKVVDEAGQPLRGVHVFLRSPSTKREDGGLDHAEGWFQTDAEGKWSCPGVAPDMSGLGLRLEHATHVDASSRAATPYFRAVTSDEFAGLRAQTDVRRMHEDPPLVGTIVDPDGQPVPNVTVDISGRNPDWSQHFARGLVITTNEAGEFRLPRPPHGQQRLTLTHPNGIRQVVEVRVAPPETLTITLSKGRRIEFRVVDTSGRPIPDVTFLPDVSGAEFRGRSDAEGRWVWDNAPDEKVRYQIVSNDYLCQPPDANYGPDDSPVTLTLRRNLPVIGRVVDAETGQPITELRLYKGSHFKVNRADSWQWWMESSQALRPVKGSWAEGKVDGQPRTQLAPGEFHHRLYTLDRLIRYRIQADGYLPAISEPLDAAALPDQPVELEFRLRKYDRIVANIRTPAGAAAAGAEVATLVKRGNDDATLSVHNGTLDESSRSRLTVAVRADAAGKFELPVHNDPFVCLITHETGYLELLDRELAERTDWTLLPWKTIEGTVMAQQAPAPGVQLSFLQFGRNPGSDGGEAPGVYYALAATTDAAGHYRTSHGLPGDWDVRVSYPAPPGSVPENADGERPSPWRSSRFYFNVTDAESSVLDVGHDGVDIIGRVVVPAGVAVDWLFSGVEFMRDLPRDATGHSRRESYQARLSPDGMFRCFNVPPGDYKCTAIAGTADDPVWSGWNMTRKRGFEKMLQLDANLFAGKSAIAPLDLGEISLEPVNADGQRQRSKANQPVTNRGAQPAAGTSLAAAQPQTAQPVSIICVDADERPVSGAEVHLFQYSGEAQRYQQSGPHMTDDQGRAVCANPRFSDQFGNYDRWVYARVPGKLVGVTLSRKSPNRKAHNPDGRVMLQPSRSIDGEVTVPTGYDVTRVLIQVRRLRVVGFQQVQSFWRGDRHPGIDEALPQFFDVRPDAQGRFQLHDIPVRGGVSLATVSAGLAQVQWFDDSGRTDIAIRLTIPPECVVKGRVLAPDGAPVAGATVTATPDLNNQFRGGTLVLSYRAATNEQGEFELHGLPQASLEVHVVDPQNRWTIPPRQDVQVHPQNVRQLDFTMEAGTLVSGKVVGPNGQPVTGAKLSAIADTARGTELQASVTDEQGLYRLRLPSGVAKLHFESVPEGFAEPEPAIVQTLDIQLGQADIENLDFTLGHRPTADR